MDKMVRKQGMKQKIKITDLMKKERDSKQYIWENGEQKKKKKCKEIRVCSVVGVITCCRHNYRCASLRTKQAYKLCQWFSYYFLKTSIS